MLRLEAADGAGDQATFVEALGAVLTFEAVGHLGKQHHTADPQVPGAAHLVPQGIQTPALAAGHGGNGFVPGPLVNEEGVDQIRGLQRSLAHHGPQGGRAPQTAGAVQQVQHTGAAAWGILRNPLIPHRPRAWQWLAEALLSGSAQAGVDDVTGAAQHQKP